MIERQERDPVDYDRAGAEHYGDTQIRRGFDPIGNEGYLRVQRLRKQSFITNRQDISRLVVPFIGIELRLEMDDLSAGSGEALDLISNFSAENSSFLI